MGFNQRELFPSTDGEESPLNALIASLLEDGICCVVVTSQEPLGTLRELMGRKRVCRRGGGMCVTTWSDALEAQLKAEQKKANIGQCLVIGSSP